MNTKTKSLFNYIFPALGGAVASLNVLVEYLIPFFQCLRSKEKEGLRLPTSCLRSKEKRKAFCLPFFLVYVQKKRKGFCLPFFLVYVKKKRKGFAFLLFVIAKKKRKAFLPSLFLGLR